MLNAGRGARSKWLDSGNGTLEYARTHKQTHNVTLTAKKGACSPKPSWYFLPLHVRSLVSQQSLQTAIKSTSVRRVNILVTDVSSLQRPRRPNRMLWENVNDAVHYKPDLAWQGVRLDCQILQPNSTTDFRPEVADQRKLFCFNRITCRDV